MAMSEHVLDAFGYWPSFRSRIRGLGGEERASDPNYVFHSNYVAIDAGPSIAEVSFDDLRARTGMIAIRVFQYRADQTPQVTETARTTALLPSVAETERPIRVAFDAVPGAQYAVNGHVFGECEARGKGIGVTLRPQPTEALDPSRARSQIGRKKARRTIGMASVEAPTLAWPVSQGFTPAQAKEPQFRRLAESIPADLPTAARWEAAYIVRVLESYGRLDPAARVLALAAASDPAARIVAAAGCDTASVLLAPGETIDDACSRAFPDPVAGRGFDVVWTRSDIAGQGGSARALSMIDDMLARLRPGGLAIHLVTTGGEMDDNALDRVALGLAAAGHVVAQLRHARADRPPAPFPFGFVIRKTTDVVL